MLNIWQKLMQSFKLWISSNLKGLFYVSGHRVKTKHCTLTLHNKTVVEVWTSPSLQLQRSSQDKVAAAVSISEEFLSFRSHGYMVKVKGRAWIWPWCGTGTTWPCYFWTSSSLRSQKSSLEKVAATARLPTQPGDMGVKTIPAQPLIAVE